MKAVEAETFLSCVALREIGLPSSVEVVGDRAFFKCIALEQIRIPRGLKRLGERAFGECAIESISLPDSVEVIGIHAFENCYWLNTVVLPKGRTWIGAAIFAGCAGLEVLVLPKKTRLLRRKRDRWRVPEEAQILFHEEMDAARLLTEFATAPDGEAQAAKLADLWEQLEKQGVARKTAKVEPTEKTESEEQK